MSDNSTQPSQPLGQRLSRYLSVRNANASTSSLPPAEDTPATPNPSSIARSMSRYRRARPVNAPTQVKSPPLPSPYEHENDAPSPRPRRRQNPSSPSAEDPFRDPTRSRNPQPSTPLRQNTDEETPRSRARRHSGSADRRPRQQRPQTETREDALLRQTSGDTAGSPRSPRLNDQNCQDHLQRYTSEQSELTRQEEEERMAQEQAERWKRIKRKELERLEKELAAAKPPVPSPKVHQSSGRFGFFTRRWGDKAPGQVAATNAEGTRFWRRKEAPPVEVTPIGGPGADAPVSAVNAGERVSLYVYILISPRTDRCYRK